MAQTRFVVLYLKIDVKTDTVRLLGIGNSNATSINKGAITHRDNLIDEIENAVNEAKNNVWGEYRKYSFGNIGRTH